MQGCGGGIVAIADPGPIIPAGVGCPVFHGISGTVDQLRLDQIDVLAEIASVILPVGLPVEPPVPVDLVDAQPDHPTAGPGVQAG